VSARVTTTELAMPLPDGARLLTEVAVADDGERHPVLLVRTPYGRGSQRWLHDPIALARDGWAVVLQDVRGRYGSEGTFEPMFQEAADGKAAVDWCAHQPWSSGAVAMTGGSYQGFTQWAAALGRPKALRAIAPAITTASVGEGRLRQGGAFRVGMWSLWGMAMAAGGTGGSRAAEKRAGKALKRWRELVRYPTNVDAISLVVPQFREWLEAAGRELAQPRPAELARIEVAGYHLGGWYDPYCEGTIAGYTALAHGARSEQVRRSQRLVVGPWSHMPRFVSFVGEVDFGPHANADAHGVTREQLAFLRDAVEGRDVKDGVSIFVMGRDRWLELDTWPPPTTELPLFLTADAPSNGARGGGGLSASPAESSGTDRFRHDPSDPVPTRGGRSLFGDLPPPGPVDQRPVEAREDVLVYTGEPLRKDVTAIGTVRAQLRFASSAARADVTVKLVDVHADGRALNVVDSVRRVELTPGRAQSVEVVLGSTAMTFRKGHRIRIEIASSNWPHVDCVEAAEQTVHWGGRSGSRLLLPLYDASAAR